nr:MAG TPA: hypothetical protein [Caudoviricetes sp.]
MIYNVILKKKRGTMFHIIKIILVSLCYSVYKEVPL